MGLYFHILLFSDLLICSALAGQFCSGQGAQNIEFPSWDRVSRMLSFHLDFQFAVFLGDSSGLLLLLVTSQGAVMLIMGPILGLVRRGGRFLSGRLLELL